MQVLHAVRSDLLVAIKRQLLVLVPVRAIVCACTCAPYYRTGACTLCKISLQPGLTSWGQHAVAPRLRENLTDGSSRGRQPHPQPAASRAEAQANSSLLPLKESCQSCERLFVCGSDLQPQVQLFERCVRNSRICSMNACEGH